MSLVIQAGDLFAGCGGTSTGLMQAVKALGGVVDLVAVNHWPLAVATHSANHVGAHYCMDLSTAEPEEMVPGRRLDLLVASPECTQFSRARGGKPVNDQRRSGADWVLRWLERLDVACLLIENVKEFMSWGDVDAATGLPLKKKNGRLFLAWLEKIRTLGYRLDFKILNAADYGDVTTRERFFLIARKDGQRIRWPTPTHCKDGKTDAFGTLSKWRAAREIIDWSNLGPSLFERDKALSLKTRLRIARGAQMFWGVLAPLYIRLLDLPIADEAKFVAESTGEIAATLTAAYTDTARLVLSVGGPAPGLLPMRMLYLRWFRVLAAVVHKAPACGDAVDAAPFVLSRNGHNDPNGQVRSVDEPSATVTGSGPGTGYLVTPTAEPFLVGQFGNSIPQAAEQPAPTVTTVSRIRLATPTAEPFVFANRNNAVPVGPDRPIPGLTTATGGGIYIAAPGAEPVVIGQQSDSAARPVRQPVMAITTGGVIRLATPTAKPFLDVYYQTGVADSIDEPLSTQTTKPRHALVSPFLVPHFGEAPGQAPRVHDVAAPLPAVTNQGAGSLVVPIASVITPGFAERAGQLPRIHDIDEPVPAIAATGHLHLATATIEIPADLADIDPRRLVVIDGVLHLLDIRFRMLTNAELAAAMGFPPDYQFHGNKGDVTKQIGNAVAVSTAAALIGAILDPEGSIALVGTVLGDTGDVAGRSA